MKLIKNEVKKLPFATLLYNRARKKRKRLQIELQWHTNAYSWASRKRLLDFKDRHQGQRCFIIGNGPSLNQMDLSPLQNEITFGMNRIYLLFSEIGFQTTYFVSVNPHVINQFAADIEQLSIPKFIGWQGIEHINFTPNMIFLRQRLYDLDFSTQPQKGVWQGATVTYVSMQLAFYMGFKTVYLIGVDHNFSTTGPAHKLVVSTEGDPNHFRPDYFGKGIRWQLPDLETSELAYTIAKNTFEQDGRQILDATVNGKLQVFPKVDYNSLF